jgi:predicted O-methyltransferase YrrM
MPGIGGLISNIRAAASSPHAWWLARQSVIQHGAIQHVDELTEFTKIVMGMQPRRILEIGTAEGGVFWLLCRMAAADATLISLDLPPQERYSGGNKIDINLESMKIPGQTVHVIHGDSHAPETPGQVQKILGDQLLDLLFIDGDHTYEGVSQDYMMYSPLVRPGGMIVFHDIVKSIWPGCQVDRFWGELEQNTSLGAKAIIGYVPSHYGGIGLVTRR